MQLSKAHISHPLDHAIQNYALELTQAAAIACQKWVGRGDEKSADHAAVEAMRNTMNQYPFDGRIVIGEGERDEAPMLYIGEKLGTGGEEVDIAVDPLEGTTLCAHSAPNSLAVLAIAPRGTMLHAPDTYMEKIAVGPNLPRELVSLELDVKNNLKNLARAKKVDIRDLKVCILDRPRHEELIAKVRESGANIQLITDGDVSAVIATCKKNTKIDMYVGTGGAPEGVLAAAALATFGGQMQGRLVFRNDDEKARAAKAGITDLTRIYNVNDMVSSDVVFAATGVTEGWMLKGVKRTKYSYKTSSLLLHRDAKIIRNVTEEIYI